jgi:hypothetical protein
LLWEEAVEAVVAFVGVAATVALIANPASTVPNSNLVEIRMLTHTSASRSCASIRQDSVPAVLRRDHSRNCGTALCSEANFLALLRAIKAILFVY